MKIWQIFVLLLAPLSLFSQNDKAIIEQVVATVGSEIILMSEVQEQVAYAKQQQPNLPGDYKCVALQNIIVQKLLVNKAKIDSIEVKDEEVETQLNARIDRLLVRVQPLVERQQARVDIDHPARPASDKIIG